jgi:hypothetical protein
MLMNIDILYTSIHACTVTLMVRLIDVAGLHGITATAVGPCLVHLIMLSVAQHPELVGIQKWATSTSMNEKRP